MAHSLTSIQKLDSKCLKQIASPILLHLGFQKHIPITQIPSIGFIMKFLTDKHRICQIDRFAQFSCKITNNYQNAIFFYEISYTKPRHMIDYPRENRFLIPILENSQKFRATYYSLQKQQQIGFLLKHPNNFQPLANNPPKSNTCST